MAKRTAKKKSAPKKQAASAAGSPQIKTIVIAVGIFAAAVLLGVVSSLIRSKQLANDNILSTTTVSSITVKDKENNKEYKIPVKPASASAVSKSNPTPVVNKPIKRDYARLFVPASSKEKILKVEIDEAKHLFDSGKAVFIDARGSSSFNFGHIKGALSLPVSLLDPELPKYKDKFKDKVLVTYCSGAGCHLSDKAAYKLFDKGYKNVVIFFGGWSKWMQAGYPKVIKERK